MGSRSDVRCYRAFCAVLGHVEPHLARYLANTLSCVTQPPAEVFHALARLIERRRALEVAAEANDYAGRAARLERAALGLAFAALLQQVVMTSAEADAQAEEASYGYAIALADREASADEAPPLAAV